MALVLTSGVSAQVVNYPQKPGFPVVLPGGGTSRGSHPAIADLGLTPGHKSIVFGTKSGRLYVVKYDGTVAPGFPVQLPSEIVSSPAVAVVGGQPAIFVGYGSNFQPGPGGFKAIRPNGSTMWTVTTRDWSGSGFPNPVVGAPAVGDVDGDGSLEVAFGSLDAQVYLVDALTGVSKPGWPRDVRDTIFSSPALHDIDGDGKLDIIIGTDAHVEGSPYNTPDGGCLHVFRYDGTEVVGFPRCIDQTIGSAPSVGDIDGDGRPDIVVGTGTFYSNAAHKVYAFRCDGTDVPGWPVSVDGQVSSSPALADLDGDGVVDVVVTDDSSPPSTHCHVYGFKSTGGTVTQLFKTVPKDFNGNMLNAGEPVVADILGDAKLEILVPTNGEICVLSYDPVSHIVTQLTESQTGAGGKKSFVTASSLSNAAADDFESDGLTMEVVAVSATPFPSATDTQVNVFNPPKLTPAGPGPWGLYRQNARRTAVVPGSPSCPDAAAPMSLYPLTPCRILDTRNPAGPYGGPSIGAQRIRTFFVLGVCGIPADARSLSVNLTGVNSTANGSLRLFGGMGPSSNGFVLLYTAGQTRASAAMVRLGAGQLSIENSQFTGSTDVILDVSGYLK